MESESNEQDPLDNVPSPTSGEERPSSSSGNAPTQPAAADNVSDIEVGSKGCCVFLMFLVSVQAV